MVSTDVVKNESVLDKENGSNSDVVEDEIRDDVSFRNSKQTIGFDLDDDNDDDDDDDDDAICKRTRARYSLASFTLDELETFLQESDGDDDIQNVDEEEEYNKFLAAVLNGGNGNDIGNVEGNEDDDDDDEDNDADFDIEIEEALESDVDDCVVMPDKDERLERATRRPETRQNTRQRTNVQSNKKVIQQGNNPLRPLLPVVSVPCVGPKYPAFGTTSEFPSCGQSNGFQPHQIGQLYCLLYEHVQLLVQVYSLCVLEPSRQHIGAQIKGLMSELLYKRDLVLAWRNGPYPASCFHPSYIGPSVSVENKKKEDSGVPPNDGQGWRWLPTVGDPVQSVLDVAPLKLVGRYIDDVSNAVREHQRRCVETTNIYLERQPLFPLPICSSPEVDCNVSKEDDPSLNTNAVSSKNIVPKKTLAATLVESTKKQSIALVSPQIAKLAEPFYSLFNPALFPYKPPSSAVANRVLFTDAEDVLLAMGIMEYNSDWKAIQQRFLPCKSENQIFVRQKNRSSSKAPENPIKSVWKMKRSPLTEEEKARIQEGLKAFKLDWTSVWINMVPYRDPNRLPRQWRIAMGTQKSYKADSAKRERHRIYESKRRRKATIRKHAHTGPEKENESGEDCMDTNEAYVHEAFLADWRPTSSGLTPSERSAANLKSGCLLGDLPVSRSCDVQIGADNHGNIESQSERAVTREVSAASEHCHLMNDKSLHPYRTSCYPSPISTSKTFGDSLFYPQRAGKPSNSNLVKLAPELPPVKLPPAVRVISQASLRSSHLGSSSEFAAAGPPEVEKSVCDPAVFDFSTNSVRPIQSINKISNSNLASLPVQKDLILKNGCPVKEKGTDMDPHMHPLLFRTIEKGHLPCYSLNNTLTIPTFSFFPPVQHQMNVTGLRNPCTSAPDVELSPFRSKEISPGSSSLDFHPLLQRAKEFNSSDAGLTCSVLNTDLELSRDQFVEDIVCEAGETTAQIADATSPTSPKADANDLDLDIHLSSASKRRKVSINEGTEINPTFASASGTRVVESVTERSGEFSQLGELQPADLVARGHMEKSGPGNSDALPHKLDGSNSACINDNVGDHPLLEIVMEQEELSDSDDEMENVEFECEEMADSDGEEGSDTEQVVNTHNKEESNAALGIDSQAQLSKSSASGASEGNGAQRKGRNPRLGSAGPGRGHTKGSWLSLNSHGSHYKSLSRIKRTESCSGDPVPSHLNGYGKKAIPCSKGSLSSEQTTDISQKDLFSAPSRNSRKHAKNSSPSIPAVPAENSSCTAKD